MQELKQENEALKFERVVTKGDESFGKLMEMVPGDLYDSFYFHNHVHAIRQKQMMI